ncbi:hypothetical protein FOZ62_017448, partial [Perkinsus olseni]
MLDGNGHPSWRPLPCVVWSPLPSSPVRPSKRPRLGQMGLAISSPQQQFRSAPTPGPLSVSSAKARKALQVAAASSPEVIDAFVYSAFAPSTTAASRSAHKLYLSICAAQCRPHLPVSLSTLLSLVHAMTEARYSAGTVKSYLSHIKSQALRSRSLSLDPADEAILQLALRASKKILGDSPKRAVTLSRDDVHAVSVHLRAKDSTAADLYLFGVAGLFRLGELLNMSSGDVQPSWPTVEGKTTFAASVFVRKSKTDVYGHGYYRPIPCISVGGTDISAGSYPQCSSELCGAHQVLYRSRSALSPCESLFAISRDSFSRLLATAITAVKGQSCTRYTVPSPLGLGFCLTLGSASGMAYLAGFIPFLGLRYVA